MSTATPTPVPTQSMGTTTKAPSASLYVGDLAPEVTEGMLFEAFSVIGNVSSIRVCRDTHTRRSLGYAYVNFHSVVDAERALDTLNNTHIASRPCRIMWSQRDPSIRKTGVGNIFIKNLDLSIGHSALYDTFSAFGNILSCKVAMDERGNSKGYGFVHFENQQCADKAIETVNNMMLLSKPVYVGHFIARKLRTQQLENSWTNVFVKDIEPTVTNEEFHALFSKYGNVTSAIIMNRETNSPSLFGFVNFSDHESAKAAVEGLNGFKLGTKTLYCARHQKKIERQARLKKEWEQLKLSKYQGINLYIKNLEDEVDEERLRKEFSQFGNIKSCKIMLDENGNSKGFGFVCFSNPEESQRAIAEKNGKILDGRCTKPLYVALHESKETRRNKLAMNAVKGMRNNGIPPSQNPSLYGQVYYSNNMSNFVGYPQQMLASMPRTAWQQPQYTMTHPPFTNPIGVIQRGGGAQGTPPSNATATRGRGSSRARGARRNQQMSGVADQVGTDITLAQLSSVPLDQQKLALGERLYPLISRQHPQLAGKITGMFLDSGWSIDEIFSLLSDEAKLNEKIEDAISVLDSAQQQQASDAQLEVQ